MNKRVILAGVLGGLGMFVWTFAAHEVLPLGEAGIQELPNEPAVLTAMQAAIGQKAGLYLFPGLGVGENATREQKSAAMEQYSQKLAANASGLMVYHGPGATFSMGKLLTTEFLTEMIEVMLAVFLLGLTRLETFGSRVGFMAAVGVIAAMTTNVPYWNWYSFPTKYTVAAMSIQLIGFTVAGVIAAAMMRTRIQAPRGRSAGAAA